MLFPDIWTFLNKTAQSQNQSDLQMVNNHPDWWLVEMAECQAAMEDHQQSMDHL
jgi:hypothetical protein